MADYFKNFSEKYPRIKKVVGIILILAGLASILTPFTPVGFLLIIGLEMLGIRFLLWDKIKEWFKK